MFLLSTSLFIQVSISRHHHQRPLRQRVPRRVSHSNPAIAAVGFPYMKPLGGTNPPHSGDLHLIQNFGDENKKLLHHGEFTLGKKTSPCKNL